MKTTLHQDGCSKDIDTAFEPKSLSELLPLELVLHIVKCCIRRKTIVIRKRYYGVGRLNKLIYFQKDLAQISEHLNLRLVSRLFYHTVWKTILDRFDGKLRVMHNFYGLYKELDFQPWGKYCWLWPRVKEMSLTMPGDAFAVPQLNLSRLPCLTKVILEHVRVFPKTVTTLSDITDAEIISSIGPDEGLWGMSEVSDGIRKIGLTLVLKIRYRVKNKPTPWVRGHKCSPGITLDITDMHNIFVISRYAHIDFTNERMDISL